ncbi:MAG: hypothetical protein H7A25_13585 [Leptospiraceae bacterium]|nr:hypothetical protein [Leptospiraceae bacterium]MCP5500934.1 hypothetical protein [Leptospiraceae bacterium]
MNLKDIFLEIRIRAPIEKVREAIHPTHQSNWDLRFSRIFIREQTEEQREKGIFTFSFVRSIFGRFFQLSGYGEIEEKEGENGEIYSTLNFGSEDSHCPIRRGKGYHLLIPETENSTLFRTEFQYRPRYGKLGFLFDILLFRHILKFVTAYSLDRLKIYLEKEIPPSLSLKRSMNLYLIRLSLCFFWVFQSLYLGYYFQGYLVHKIYFRLYPDANTAALSLVNIPEVIFGLLFIFIRDNFYLYILNFLIAFSFLVLCLYKFSILHTVGAFSFLLYLFMMLLSVFGLLGRKDIPYAGNCKTRIQKS